MPLGTGTLFAGYQIDRLLGRGGMGEVYLARHLVLGRLVALKLPAPELAADERFRKRFLSESRSAAALDHPNVVTVYEAGEADGRLYLAMRYVEGVDLDLLLEREGRLDPGRAIGLLTGIANALDAAHRIGLVHRDVKPGNILIAGSRRPDERAYLADFGLVKEIGSDASLTATGQFFGSAGHVAPEQIEGRPVDARADVYSLAAVVYHALAGHPPFERATELATVWAHVHAPPPELSELRPELASLDAALQRGMAKEPRDRQQTAGALLTEVAAALRRSGGVALSPAEGSTDATAAPPAANPGLGRDALLVEPGAVVRRHRARALTGPVGMSTAGMTFALLAVLAIGAFALSGGSPTQPPGSSTTIPSTAAGASPARSAEPSQSGPPASDAIRGVPIGLALEAGWYETSRFQPALSFAAETGWTTIGSRFGDDEAGFDLARTGVPSNRVSVIFSTTVSRTGCLDEPSPYRLGGGTVGPGETRPSVPGSLLAIEELRSRGLLGGGPWLLREGLDLHGTGPIVGNVTAQIDVVALRVPECTMTQDGVAIVRRNAPSSGRPESDEWVQLPAGGWARVMPAPGIIVEGAGEMILIIQSGTRQDFEAFLPIALRLLETMTIAQMSTDFE